MLDKPAVYVEVVGKSVTVKQIFELLLSEYRHEKNPKAKKAKEYITFNQFMDYFKRWDNIQLSNIDRQIKTKTSES
jgi:predicted RNA-binding protein with RPS1 domain